MEESFACSYNPCIFQSRSFRRYIIHTWDKHSLSTNFLHECQVSECTKKYTNQQSFIRHLKLKHKWFYDIHYSNTGCSSTLTEPDSNDNSLHNQSSADTESGNIIDLQDTFSANDSFTSLFEAKYLVSEVLLELREKYNTTTKATNFIAEKICNILD